MTKQREPAYTMSVTLGASQYGYPQPQMEVRLHRGTSYRVVKAALHRLAAEVELATPAHERWIVQVEERGDTAGRVYLELAGATEEEAKRGLQLLQAVASTH